MNSKIENELKQQLELERAASKSLKKAIWDMLNYNNVFVLMLDSEMTIRLINWSLATKLGFKDEREPLGKCWLDFVNPIERDSVKVIHSNISKGNVDKYREVVSGIITLDNEMILVRWFNIQINNKYNMTFSFGLQRDEKITEESIRSYYKDIIERDKTMIKALKDVVIGNTHDINAVYEFEQNI